MKPKFQNEVYNCMVALSAIDGINHIKEEDILKKYKKKWSIATPKVKTSALIKNKKLCEKVFNTNFNKICESGSMSDLYNLLHYCNEITDADKSIHIHEEKILNLIQKSIGDGSFYIANKDINWNKKQLEIINQGKNKRILVEAPPGAGKTEIISKKVFDLINKKNVKPRNILLISFTNNAVREMQERIFHYSNSANGKKKFPLGLNISTIDSQAFRLNSSLREDYMIRDGYEKNIEDFLKILQSNAIDFLETWDELEHIFIDEAQDLVGLRKEICNEFIRLSNPDTGISIFGDSCQQIYPWEKQGEKKLTKLQKESLMDLIVSNYSDSFESIELKTIHRTDSNFLKILLDDMRLNIASAKNIDKSNSPMTKIESKPGNIMQMNVGDDYLFLFRTNSEVVDAAFSLNAAKKVYRIKSTSGKYPSYLKSWLSKLFIYCELNQLQNIDKESFFEFIKSVSSRHASSISEREYMWENLKKYSIVDNETISLKLLMNVVSIKMPLEFKNIDFGFRGPKLSTVHASKGSQAANVIISNWNTNDSISHDESKVVFVGISRAKKSLQKSNYSKKRYFRIPENYEIKNNSYARSKVLNRYYRLISNYQNVVNYKEKPVYIIEIGLCGDYDPLSIIKHSNISYEEAKRTQKFLSEVYVGNNEFKIYAKRENIQQREFKIFLESGSEKYILGSFSSQVIDNVSIASKKFIDTKKYVPPLLIDNLNLLDIASYVLPEGKIEKKYSKDYLKPFMQSKSWLYPVIYGSARFSLHFRK